MASTTHPRPIPGSERTALPGAHIVGTADPQERLLVTVLVRRRPTSPGLTAMLEAGSTRLPGQRQHMRHDEFAAVHGAAPDDLNTIEAFAHEHDLDIVAVNPAPRRVVLSGTVASLSAAFGVSLARYEHPGGTYRGRTPVQVPAELAPLIQGVFGLDNRPQARPHLRLLQAPEGAPQPRAGSLSYTPLQVAQLYNFPAPNTDQGFLDVIATAVHDTRNRPTVISISWGGPESAWTSQAMQAMDQAFQDAAALGVTVCCASGDDGSSDARTGLGSPGETKTAARTQQLISAYSSRG